MMGAFMLIKNFPLLLNKITAKGCVQTLGTLLEFAVSDLPNIWQGTVTEMRLTTFHNDAIKRKICTEDSFVLGAFLCNEYHAIVAWFKRG